MYNKGQLPQLEKEYLETTYRTSIIINDERLNVFSLKLGTVKDGHSHHSYSIKCWKS